MPIRADILTQLADVLAELYYDQGSIHTLVVTGGLKPQRIPVYPRADRTWVFVLEEAEDQGRTQAILDRARSEKPVYEPLRLACQAYAEWVAAGRPGQATAYGPAEKPYRLHVPSPPEQFVGRDELVQELADKLCASPNPTLALHGLPGVGKSTLAAVLANDPEVQKHFADGVLWAGLGPSADVMSILAAWGQALGLDVTDQPTPELRAQAVGRVIGSQRLLLVLDDAWEIEPARLLRVGGTNSGHLLTTRDLGLARTFAGRPQAISIPVLEDDPAFLLLQTLAPEACAAGDAVARRLAQSLGGLPLALELVGGFLATPEHSLFPELGSAALGEMADPAQRLQLASVRLGALDGRQVSLQDTITLSLEHLPPSAAETFYALGAFAARPATFNLDAAKAVAQADAATLAKLVARSLVEQAGPEMLAMHQTIADVARTRLPPEAVQRHRDYYLDLVDEDREDWQRIQEIYPQVTQAWAQLGDTTERVFDFVWYLGIYQERQGLWQDKLAWAGRGLEIARAQNLEAEAASMLIHLGYVYNALGEKQQALAYFEQALPLWRQVGDQAGEAGTLHNIGAVYDALGEKQQALAYYEQALPLSRQVGDRSGEAMTLNNIGKVYADLGEKQQALAYYEQALPFRRQMGDRSGEAMTLNNIGGVYHDLGEKQQALAYYEQALPLRRQVGDRSGEATTLNNIGLVYADLGEMQQALAYYEQALPLSRQVGDQSGEATTLNNIGLVYSALGEKQQALAYYEQALPLSRQVGDRWGESITRYNMAMVYQSLDRLAEAEAQLIEVVALDEAIGHPDLDSDRAALEEARAARRAQAPGS